MTKVFPDDAAAAAEYLSLFLARAVFGVFSSVFAVLAFVAARALVFGSALTGLPLAAVFLAADFFISFFSFFGSAPDFPPADGDFRFFSAKLPPPQQYLCAVSSSLLLVSMGSSPSYSEIFSIKNEKVSASTRH
jgi:hypothetical protein